MSDRRLTSDELVELTGRRQAAAQCRALARAGIRHHRLPGAAVFVLLSWLAPVPVERPREGARLHRVK